MKQRLMIILLIVASLAILPSCSNSSDDDSPVEITGNWYVMQYWGTKITKTTYEKHSKSGVKVTEDSTKTKNESWDKTYDYGRNIWSFKEDNTVSITDTDLPDYLYYNIGEYILDSSAKKLTMQTKKGEVSAIYDIIDYSQNMVTLCWKPKLPVSTDMNLIFYSGEGAGGCDTIYTTVSTDETRYLKLKRMN